MMLPIHAKAIAFLAASGISTAALLVAENMNANELVTGGLSLTAVVTAVGGLFTMREKVRRNEQDMERFKAESTQALERVCADFTESLRDMREEHRGEMRGIREDARADSREQRDELSKVNERTITALTSIQKSIEERALRRREEERT